MKLLLTSAGITNTSIFDALIELVGKELEEIKVAFILTAKNNREVPAEEAMKNQIGQLLKYGFHHYQLVDPSTDTDWKMTLDTMDFIVIGGGNTFHLLNEARKTGFDKWLRDNAENKVYMGISAGSILMTPNIGIAHVGEADENTAKIKDLSGLGFVQFEVSPHTPEEVTYEENEAYFQTTNRSLYTLDDQSAIIVNDGLVEVVSEGSWRVYDQEDTNGFTVTQL